jgi:transposase
MARPSRYPKELLDRGVRLTLEDERLIAHIARDLGIGPETLRKDVRRAQIDAGKREGMSTSEREELNRLRRENFELRRANTILKEASVFFAGSSTQTGRRARSSIGCAIASGSSPLAGAWAFRRAYH